MKRIEVRSKVIILTFVWVALNGFYAYADAESKGSPSADATTSHESRVSNRSENVLAKGNGILVTKDQVKRLREIMDEKDFRSTDKEYVKAAVKMAIFAKAAEDAGVALSEEKIRENEKIQFEVGSLEHVWANSEMYLTLIENTYPISDAAIESYFWANPELFEETVEVKDDEGKGHVVKEMSELDEDTRKFIRAKLVKARFPMTVYEEYTKLMDKYNVKFCSTGECE